MEKEVKITICPPGYADGYVEYENLPYTFADKSQTDFSKIQFGQGFNGYDARLEVLKESNTNDALCGIMLPENNKG